MGSLSERARNLCKGVGKLDEGEKMPMEDAIKPGAVMEPVNLNLGGSWGDYILIPHHSRVEGCTQGVSAP